MPLGEQFSDVLNAARTGAPWALERLYREFHPSVLAFLRARAPADAEDLASEVFIAVAEGLVRFEGDEDGFRSWLFTITYRQ
ncbi:MAG: sigma-70 family RNA polymerase sigma factor, partial [Acidimicrobiia bacterium]|nr:sigma-70 family RNA polymerase sigma factor [Acidimicrobiia bacterium]